MKDLNVTLANSANQVIRIGEAEKIYEPHKIAIVGDINAPVAWVKNRFVIDGELNKQSHATFEYKECEILIVVNESNHFFTTVRGRAEKNKFLQNLRINNPKGYRREELLEAFRFNGQYFNARENHRDLIGKINKFDAKVNREFKTDHDRTKGISNNMANSKVDSDLADFKITLNVPVLEGFDRQVIELAIEVEDQNGIPMFYLICDDIDSVVEANVEAAFAKAEAVFVEYGIVCIHQR
jgi:hypothetical protein